MASICIPNRITWLVDLRNSLEERFPHTVVKRIENKRYNERIRVETLPANKISEIFLPIYQELIISRDDFRLDEIDTIKKIEIASRDGQYRLLWFTDLDSGEVLGGTIYHLLSDQVRVAYRCFYHERAKELGFEELDYFAEAKLQTLAKKMNYGLLCQGNDRHPVSQVGLSIFKLRVGAKPAVSPIAQDVEVKEEDLKVLLGIHGVAGYYSDPVGEVYTKFNLYGENSENVRSFVKVAQLKGIDVVMCDLEKFGMIE